MNSRLLPLGAAFLTLLIVLTAVWVLDQSEQSRIRQENRTDVLHQLSRIRAELELALNERSRLAEPLVTYIATHGHIDGDIFDTYAGLLIRRLGGIQAITLIREGIVVNIFPKDRYGSFIGSNLALYGDQRAAIQRAIDTKDVVIGGPVTVEEFGTILIARTPIFMVRDIDEHKQGELWGLVSIVMSLDAVLDNAGLGVDTNGLEFAVRRTDGLGPVESMIFGSSELFDPMTDAAMLDVNLPGGSLELAAIPSQGWTEVAPESWKWRAGGVLLGLLSATMVFSLIRQPVRLRRAVRQATSELRKSEARYRRLFEESRDPILISNQEGRLIDVNQAAVDMLGFSREELIGLDPREVYADPADFEKFQRDIEAHGSVRDYVERLRRKGGGEIYCQVSSTIRRNEKGEFVGYQGILRDITERRKAELGLRETLEFNRRIIEAVPGGIVQVDMDGRILLANTTAQHILEMTWDSASRVFVTDFNSRTIFEDGRECRTDEYPVSQCLKTGEAAGPSLIGVRRRSGDLSWAYFSAIPTFAAETGGQSGALVTFLDITPRKRVEEALRRSEEELRIQAKSLAAVNAIADTLYRSLDFATVVRSALESIIEHVNVPTASLFSVNSEEDTLTALAHHGIARAALAVGTELKVEETFTGRAVRTKDIIVSLDIASEPRFDESSRTRLTSQGFTTLITVPLLYKDHVEGVLNLLYKEPHDVGRQERETLLSMGKTIGMAMANARQVTRIEAEIAERKRAEEALRYAQFALDHATDAIFWLEVDARYTYVNEAACRMLGYGRGQLLAMGVMDIDPTFSHEGFAKYWSELKKLGSGTIETKVRSRTGEIIPVELTVNLLEFQGREFACTFARDLRDRKRAEQEKQDLEGRLRHTQKMEAIGNLAGGVAHDFNNLLTGILGYSSMLKTGTLPPEKISKAAGVIEQAATRAAELTSQLLGFARRGKLQIQPVHIHTAIEEVTTLLVRTLDKNVRIQRVLCSGDPMVLGDPGQIQQVILNLAVNARDAMPDGGELTIATSIVDMTANGTVDAADLQPGQHLLLEVRDTGCGIAPEYMDRVFEPFFTTKEQGKGTGMGLAMAYGIVKNHGGLVRIESAPGKGTSVRIYLPLAEKKAVTHENLASAAPLRGEGRILLVDDEEVVRETASALLTTLGYEVEVAIDAREAIEKFSPDPVRFDLIVLDMILPGVGGRECFQQMKAIYPGVKAILSTGYGRDGAAQEILNEGIVGFIQKPYRIQTLSEAILHALGRSVEKTQT